MNARTKETLQEAAEVDALLQGESTLEALSLRSSAADPEWLFNALTRSYYLLAEQTMATQHRVIREYAHSVQAHTHNVWQLWLGAWGLLSDVRVPLTAEEASAASAGVPAAAPAPAQKLVRVKRSSRRDGQERRASAP